MAIGSFYWNHPSPPPPPPHTHALHVPTPFLHTAAEVVVISCQWQWPSSGPQRYQTPAHMGPHWNRHEQPRAERERASITTHAYLQYNSVKSILGVNINSTVLVMGCDYPDPSLPLTNLLISLSLSGAVLDVALIIFEVWDSDSFIIHLWPGTRLHTWVGGSEVPSKECQGQHAPTKRNGHSPSPPPPPPPPPKHTHLSKQCTCTLYM